MYGKIFDSIYDGTLRANWQALVTFQQMITLCDSNGVVDMTPEALSARTGIPLEIIQEGLKFLSAPDPYSRTKDMEGARIKLIDDHRPWGWFIINKHKYDRIRSNKDRQEYMREYMKERRKQFVNKKLTDVNKELTNVNCKQMLTPLASVSVSVPVSVKKNIMSGKPDDAHEILKFLNAKTGRCYKPLPANLELIKSRLKESNLQDLKSVIAKKTRDWKGTDFEKYLRPATLFNRTKFAQYLGELTQTQETEVQNAMPRV